MKTLSQVLYVWWTTSPRKAGGLAARWTALEPYIFAACSMLALVSASYVFFRGEIILQALIGPELGEFGRFAAKVVIYGLFCSLAFPLNAWWAWDSSYLAAIWRFTRVVGEPPPLSRGRRARMHKSVFESVNRAAQDFAFTCKLQEQARTCTIFATHQGERNYIAHLRRVAKILARAKRDFRRTQAIVCDERLPYPYRLSDERNANAYQHCWIPRSLNKFPKPPPGEMRLV